MIPRFKTKNAKTFNLTVKDDNGVIVSDLLTADDIIFVFKEKKTDSDLDSNLIKKLSLTEITVNDPSTGIIKIKCTSTDLGILGTVFIACQINYPGDENIEVNLSDSGTGEEITQVQFFQDVIRG